MKLLAVLLFTVFFAPENTLWLSDFTKAKQEARQSSKFVLLNFSGSDWCIPCIKMHKTFFETPDFESFAEKNLVLVNADFPRLSKHQLSKDQQKQNEDLAEKYNRSGVFPYTLLLDADGKVIKSWEGCPNKTVENFIQEINLGIHGNQ